MDKSAATMVRLHKAAATREKNYWEECPRCGGRGGWITGGPDPDIVDCHVCDTEGRVPKKMLPPYYPGANVTRRTNYLRCLEYERILRLPGNDWEHSSFWMAL